MAALREILPVIVLQERRKKRGGQYRVMGHYYCTRIIIIL